ncbi:MAG TPA: hypothetical protein VEX68_11965 [Bryobacteraceae bacterium]|nr:hypothetical protein [Bryobacteraceae bacterium]
MSSSRRMGGGSPSKFNGQDRRMQSLRRQARYEAAGLECFWLAGPTNEKSAAGVPSHLLTGDHNALYVEIPRDIAARPNNSSL